MSGSLAVVGAVCGCAAGRFGDFDAQQFHLGGQTRGELSADPPGDALGGGVDLAVGEWLLLVQVGVVERRDDGLQVGLKVVEVHDGLHGVEVFASDGGADGPVVAVYGFAGTIGQSKGVGGGEGVFDGDFVVHVWANHSSATRADGRSGCSLCPGAYICDDALMLQRVTHSNGVVTLQSPRLASAGVIHGFTTRVGGISRGSYASLNLASLDKGNAGDTNTTVAENFRRLRRALGCVGYPRVQVRQVHGAQVHIASAGLASMREVACADAIISGVPGQLLTIRVADCVPVLLADEAGRVVAAVHAGWRGIVAGVVGAAVEQMVGGFGLRADELVAAIGPHIRPGRFEVGPEVIQAFEQADLADAVVAGPGRGHVDMCRAVLAQLAQAGVGAERVDVGDGCTYEDEALYYSYRRDGDRSGRMAAVIAVREDGAASASQDSPPGASV